jgi:hypothetical protein
LSAHIWTLQRPSFRRSEGSACSDLDYIRHLTQQGIATLVESRGPLKPLLLCDERDDLVVQYGDQFKP